MATTSGFLKAEAHLLHLSGQPVLALQKLMALNTSSAFEYLEDGLKSPMTSTTAHRQLVSAAQDLKEDFIQADTPKFARLVLHCFPAGFQAILAELSNDELKFR